MAPGASLLVLVVRFVAMSEEPAIAELLQQWDRLLIARASDDDPPVEPVIQANSVLRAGASPAAIAACEDRVGVQLPADYKEFLALSDGAYADVGEVIHINEAPHREFSDVHGVGLLPAADVDRLERLAPDWLDAFSIDELLCEEEEPPYDGQEVADFRNAPKAVVVATSYNGSLMLLVPASDRWEVWDYYSAVAHRYLSFRNWLAWRVRRLRPLPEGTAVLDALLEQAAAGDREAAEDVSKVDGSEFESAVIAAMQRSEYLPFVAGVLSRWPSDDMVESIERAFTAADRSMQSVLVGEIVRIGTPRAEAFLRQIGADSFADLVRSSRERPSGL